MKLLLNLNINWKFSERIIRCTTSIYIVNNKSAVIYTINKTK